MPDEYDHLRESAGALGVPPPTYIDFRPEHEIFQAVQVLAAKAFGSKATVIRCQQIEDGTLLVVTHTRREWGTYAIHTFHPFNQFLHNGHYFDSITDATNDFKARGGTISNGA